MFTGSYSGSQVLQSVQTQCSKLSKLHSSLSPDKKHLDSTIATLCCSCLHSSSVVSVEAAARRQRCPPLWVMSDSDVSATCQEQTLGRFSAV